MVGRVKGESIYGSSGLHSKNAGQELHFCSQFTFKRADSKRKGTSQVLSTEEGKKNKKKERALRQTQFFELYIEVTFAVRK